MKHRRVPGPAGLQSSHQDDAPPPTNRTAMQQSNPTQLFSFQSLDSWKALMSSMGGIAKGSDSNRTTVTQIADIHQGLCEELRVPLMTVVIEQAQLSEGTWIINMKDETGAITGFLPLDAAKNNPNILCKHSSVLLQNVAVFVSKEIDFSSVEPSEHGRGRSHFKRYLILHSNCISAVFTASMFLERDGGDGSSGLNHVNNGSIGTDIPAECNNLPFFPLTRSSPSSSALLAPAPAPAPAAAAAAPAAMSAVSEDYSAFHFPAATSSATSIWDLGPSDNGGGGGGGGRGREGWQPATADLTAPKRKRAVD